MPERSLVAEEEPGYRRSKLGKTASHNLQRLVFLQKRGIGALYNEVKKRLVQRLRTLGISPMPLGLTRIFEPEKSVASHGSLPDHRTEFGNARLFEVA
jgi:hypothetical protein